MSDNHSVDELKKHVRTYMLVFGALLLGTAITVGLYCVHFESVALTVSIALFVASIKSFLVAGFFMHLISEKKAIYAMLITTAVFFVSLMFLTIWAMHDYPVVK